MTGVIGTVIGVTKAVSGPAPREQPAPEAERRHALFNPEMKEAAD